VHAHFSSSTRSFPFHFLVALSLLLYLLVQLDGFVLICFVIIYFIIILIIIIIIIIVSKLLKFKPVVFPTSFLRNFVRWRINDIFISFTFAIYRRVFIVTSSGNVKTVPKEKVVFTNLHGEYQELTLRFGDRVLEAKDVIKDLLAAKDLKVCIHKLPLGNFPCSTKSSSIPKTAFFSSLFTQIMHLRYCSTYAPCSNHPVILFQESMRAHLVVQENALTQEMINVSSPLPGMMHSL
jgi:hypothetical protein